MVIGEVVFHRTGKVKHKNKDKCSLSAGEGGERVGRGRNPGGQKHV